MSTKIYDAYKVKGCNTLGDIQNLLLEVREKVVNHYKEYAKSPEIIEVHKQQYSGNEKEREAFKKVFGSGFVTDVNENAVVYTYKNEIYVQFFIGRLLRDVHEYIEKHEKFEDFHYQNQSDQPDDVSDEEWEKRREIWDGIFPHMDTPLNAGFSFQFMTFYDFDLMLTINALEANRKKQNDKTEV